MNKPLMREKMKKWALDMHKFNEPVTVARLYRVAAMTFYRDKWDAIHWTDKINEYSLAEKERLHYIDEMKRAWQYMEKIEDQLNEIAADVMDELEESGIDLS